MAAREVLMGDLVLTQEQVNPVLPPYSTMALKLPRCTTIFSLRSRASQQARSWHGEASNLAHAIKPALDLIGHISSAPAGAKPAAAAAASATTFSFDTAPLNKIAGFAGEKLGSVYKFTLGRDNTCSSPKWAPRLTSAWD